MLQLGTVSEKAGDSVWFNSTLPLGCVGLARASGEPPVFGRAATPKKTPALRLGFFFCKSSPNSPFPLGRIHNGGRVKFEFGNRHFLFGRKFSDLYNDSLTSPSHSVKSLQTLRFHKCRTLLGLTLGEFKC